MEKRMNKQELAELIKSLGLDKEDFYVISSGSLVLRGLLPDAGDADLAVNKNGFEKLNKKFHLIPKGDNWYKINDRCEFVFKDDKEFYETEPELCGDIYVQNINVYYNYLLTSQRDKDKKRIPIVEEYISNKNNVKS